MKQLVLLLALLVLSNCSSERDRCIKANSGNLEYKYNEKWDELVAQWEKENGVKGGLSDIESDLAKVTTEFERKVNECTSDRNFKNIDFNDKDWVTKTIERFEVIQESCEKNVSLEMIDKATEICNSQGIY